MLVAFAKNWSGFGVVCYRDPMWNRKARPMPVLLASVAALGFLAAQIAACSTDAVGIEACRTIETERCKLAPTCASVKGSPKIKTQTQVDNCVNYYHDHCLVGVENPKAGNSLDSAAKSCVEAIQATIACQKSGLPNMEACSAAGLGAAVDNGALSPCEVFTSPEHLDACRFVESQTSSTTAATTTSTTAAATTSTTTGTGSGGSGGSGG